DRHAMLSPQLLQLLRAWWPEGRRRNLLLPGGHVYSPAAIQLRRCRPASSAALSVPLPRPRGCRHTRASAGIGMDSRHLGVMGRVSLTAVLDWEGDVYRPALSNAMLARC